MAIPFLDLRRAVAALRPELDEAHRRVFDSGVFLQGPELEAFEAEWAAFCGARHAVGVASGLAALELILRAAGIGAGDEVIVPSNTCIATWLSVSHAGATPVPVDPDPASRNIDPRRVEAAIGPRTKAIVAVHLYGLPAKLDTLGKICAARGLRLFVDAAQAAGAEIGGSRSAALGDAAAFSFYPTKNLGAYADAGAVATDDAALAERVRLLRNYGMRDRYRHDLAGTNARMGELQAAFLRCGLPRLGEWNQRRREIARLYREELAGLEGIELPVELPGRTHVWHLFTALCAERDRLQEGLARAGIGTAVHYPVPPHRSGAYAGPDGQAFAGAELPVADDLAGRILSLPLHPFLGADEAATVCREIRRLLG